MISLTHYMLTNYVLYSYIVALSPASTHSPPSGEWVEAGHKASYIVYVTSDFPKAGNRMVKSYNCIYIQFRLVQHTGGK